MRRIISIVDPDTQYAGKLAEYINSHDAGGLKAVTFSDVASYRSNRKDYDTRILLVEERMLADLHENDVGESLVVALSEDGLLTYGGITAVFKYTRGDVLLRELMKVYSEAEPSEKLVRVTNHKAQIIGIYSPVGRCGKTSFALCLSCTLAAKGKLLLLSLDEYAGVFRYIAAEAESDLSDVIYAYRQGEFSWSRLAQSVYSYGTMDYIPPVRYPEDIDAIRPEQMAELIEQMARDGGYDFMVLDIGSYGKRAGDLLEKCDRIFMPVTDSETALLKVDEFVQMLEQSGFGEVAARIERLHLPYEERYEKMQINEEEYRHGKLYEYAGTL